MEFAYTTGITAQQGVPGDAIPWLEREARQPGDGVWDPSLLSHALAPRRRHKQGPEELPAGIKKKR